MRNAGTSLSLHNSRLSKSPQGIQQASSERLLLFVEVELFELELVVSGEHPFVFI